MWLRWMNKFCLNQEEEEDQQFGTETTGTWLQGWKKKNLNKKIPHPQTFEFTEQGNAARPELDRD